MAKKPPQHVEPGIEAAPRRYKDILDRELVRDPRLSLRALGAAVRLLSNAPGYRMTSLDLARERPTGEGRDAVRAALSELEAVGYLQRRVERLENGQCVTRMVIIDVLPPPVPENPAPVPKPENPAPVPKPENPASGFPVVGGSGAKSRYSNRENSKSNITTTTTTMASELVWPRQLTVEQIVVVLGVFEEEELSPELRQAVLDEFSGRHRIGKPPSQPMSWLPSTIRKAARGQFVLDAGIPVAKERARRAQEAEEREASRRAEEERQKRRVDPEVRKKGLEAMAAATAALAAP